MEVKRRLWWGRGVGIGEDHSRCGEEVMARDKSGLHELVFLSGNSIDNLHDAHAPYSHPIHRFRSSGSPPNYKSPLFAATHSRPAGL